MLFPAHLQARELCPQTYSLEGSHVTHILARIKTGGAYMPKKSAFYSTFARQLCDDTHVFQDGSAFAATHKHSSLLQQALHTQIANCHTQWTKKSFCVCVCFLLLSVGGFLQSSDQPHDRAARPLQKAACHIEVTHPLVDSSCHYGKLWTSQWISIVPLWSPDY